LYRSLKDYNSKFTLAELPSESFPESKRVESDRLFLEEVQSNPLDIARLSKLVMKLPDIKALDTELYQQALQKIQEAFENLDLKISADQKLEVVSNHPDYFMDQWLHSPFFVESYIKDGVLAFLNNNKGNTSVIKKYAAIKDAYYDISKLYELKMAVQEEIAKKDLDEPLAIEEFFGFPEDT